MSKHNLFRSLSLCAAALASVTVLTADTRQATVGVPQTARAPHGSSVYSTYCASCHGGSAHGDGPLAAALRRRPADLTGIAQRNGGVYPKDLVIKIIDGRQKVPGHGAPDMPVWGDVFQRSLETRDESAVAARIQALADYLETLQARGPAGR